MIRINSWVGIVKASRQRAFRLKHPSNTADVNLPTGTIFPIILLLFLYGLSNHYDKVQTIIIAKSTVTH